MVHLFLFHLFYTYYFCSNVALVPFLVRIFGHTCSLSDIKLKVSLDYAENIEISYQLEVFKSKELFNVLVRFTAPLCYGAEVMNISYGWKMP